jgi:hypothetical protein
MDALHLFSLASLKFNDLLLFVLQLVKDELGFCDHLKYFYVLNLLLLGVCKFNLTCYMHRHLLFYMLLYHGLVRPNLVVYLVSDLLLLFVLLFYDIKAVI